MSEQTPSGYRPSGKPDTNRVLPDSLLKLIGDYGMAREEFGVGTPGHIEAWLHLINGIKLYADYCAQEAMRSKPDQEIRPCRCGPDMCADSVACPRHNHADS